VAKANKARRKHSEPKEVPQKVAEYIASCLQNPDNLITTEEAAKMLGTTRATIDTWRCKKLYPLPHVKIGASVKYRRSDVLEFINARRVVVA
jgi:excisionase family DNA binding protein